MTIVADGVDQAEQPEALLDTVFKPLADSGARLVLGFRHGDSASLAMARTLAADTVAGRLDALGARIARLAESGTPGDRVTGLRVPLTVLRRAATEDADLVASRLAKLERAIARAERDLAAALRRADAISADLGLLEATKARAAEGGLIEHIGLAALYRTAHGALTAEPVDVAAAHAAVRAYQDAVRHELSIRE
jgi:serine protease Do